jgi:hypothetical protein
MGESLCISFRFTRLIARFRPNWSRTTADVLNIVRRLHLEEAHVDCDGRYSFSVRCCGVGLWCIFQRDQIGCDSDAIEVFG